MLTLNNRELRIAPPTGRDLVALLPVAAAFDGDSPPGIRDLVVLLPKVIEALAVLADVPRDELLDLRLDELFRLAGRYLVAWSSSNKEFLTGEFAASTAAFSAVLEQLAGDARPVTG